MTEGRLEHVHFGANQNAERELLDSVREGESSAVPERRAFRILVWLAAAALLLAVALNFLLAPDVGDPLAGPRLAEAPIPSPTGVNSGSDTAVGTLPERVLQYETITYQAIPGQGERAVEAVYNTLQMNLEAQRSMSTYARVETFASASEAEARMTGLIASFPVDAGQVMVNGVKPATEGFSQDRGALVTAWTSGSSVTFIKTSFRDVAPVKENDLLRRLHDPVVRAVEVFQRTGEEGIGGNAQLREESGTLPSVGEEETGVPAP